MTKILVIIPVRTGRKGIPNGNLKSYLRKKVISSPFKALLVLENVKGLKA